MNRKNLGRSTDPRQERATTPTPSNPSVALPPPRTRVSLFLTPHHPARNLRGSPYKYIYRNARTDGRTHVRARARALLYTDTDTHIHARARERPRARLQPFSLTSTPGCECLRMSVTRRCTASHPAFYQHRDRERHPANCT